MLPAPNDAPAALDDRQRAAAGAYDTAMALLGLDAREQQRAIVAAVSSPARGVLALEAPTGTGKSLGALIGAAARVSTGAAGTRVAVATYTNVLREQYLLDLGRAQRAFPRLTFATVAGASAYTCRNRAAAPRLGAGARCRAATRAFLAATDPQQPPAQRTPLTVAALADPDAQRWVRADASECALDQRCNRRDGGCGLGQARQAARAAQVVVTNHALLTINADAGSGVIGAFDVLVVDEVHRLAEALRSAGSTTVSQTTLALGRPLLRSAAAHRLDALIAQVNATAPINERWVEHGARGAASSFEDFAAKLDPALVSSARTCADDAARAHRAAAAERGGHVENDHHGDPGQDPRCARCRALGRDVRRAADHVALLGALGVWTGCATPPRPGQVREHVGTVRRWRSAQRALPTATLTLTPVNTTPAALALVDSTTLVVAISATVGCAADAVYALREAGLVDALAAPVVRLPPAFDYPVQMVARFERRHAGQRGGSELQRLWDALDVSDGAALVLTASHRRKDELAALLSAHAGGQFNVYTQPPASQAQRRGAVVARFAADTASVLVGTRSYFEGIDVPGQALRHVIVADRPAPPFGPLQRQLDVNLRESGSTWENAHQVPQVQMALEQIAGRLIRSRADSGWVTWLDTAADPRTARWYERQFDAAIARFGPVHVEEIR